MSIHAREDHLGYGRSTGQVAHRLALFVIPLLAALVAGPTPAHADFYTAPDPLPPGRAGDVIRAEAMTAYELPALPLRANAWRVLYRSTSATGRPIAVSGVVMIPTSPYPGPRPLVGYAIGTQGLADRCAPSHQLDAGTEYEAPIIDQVLAKGWAIALTDYPGLGTPGDHTYVVGRALGAAVLDAMRAARRLTDAALPADGPLALMGYSEGGGAAAAAAELQPAYAPDLALAGAAVGGVPADVELDVRHVDGTPAGWWLSLYAAIGFAAAYPDLDLGRSLNDRGRQYVTRFRDTCIQDAFITAATAPSYYSRDYFTDHVYARADWLARMRQNRLGSQAPAKPVLIQHARDDQAVAYGPGRALYKEWCSLGADAHFRDAPGEHLSGGLASAQPAIDFIAARFADVPLPRATDCKATPQRQARVALRILRAGRRFPQRTGKRFAVRLTAVGGAVRDVRVTLRDRGRRLLARRSHLVVRGRTNVALRLFSGTRRGQRLVLRAAGRGPDGQWVRASPRQVRIGPRPRGSG